MSSLRRTIFVSVLSFLGAQMLGCVSSSLVDMWHDPAFTAPPLGKMLVVAVRSDATKRRIWEDAFAGELVKHNVVATTSYSLFPDAPPDSDQVVAAVQESGFDGVLVTYRLPTETDRQYIRGYTTTEQDVRYSPRFGPYWQRYRTFYREVEHPGYVDSQKVAIRTIDVTTTGDGGRLIWSATSRTPDPGSVVDVQQGVAGLVMSELTAQGVIGPKK